MSSNVSLDSLIKDYAGSLENALEDKQYDHERKEAIIENFSNKVDGVKKIFQNLDNKLLNLEDLVTSPLYTELKSTFNTVNNYLPVFLFKT